MSEKQPLVSIIMPFYNRADVISETLDSVLNQTFRDFELICVDDGSTDQVPQILTAYAAKDPRIKFIRKRLTNSGDTRNVGFRHSVGKYIFFLDSDDLFAPNFLQKMVTTLEQEQSDVVICKYDQFNHLTKQVTQALAFDKFTPEHEITTLPFDVFKPMLFTITIPFVWNKIFKREIIEKFHIRFQSLPFNEDTFFVWYYLIKCQKITLLDDCLVHYRTNDQRSNFNKYNHLTSWHLPMDYLKTKLSQQEFTNIKNIFNQNYLEQSYYWFFKAVFSQRKRIFNFMKNKIISLDTNPLYPKIKFYSICLQHCNCKTFLKIIDNIEFFHNMYLPK